eukprot:TRINITY_DN103543_c0_g1_i1.p1 TRINITY_DN103543_c0_g1~~TRINITY_DN103543_c0_g1_i1.p1  ORF type:complete len:122 (-),score=10.96 TRINITY_DN103543_c0_g1_i1:9-374(-)
MSTDGFFYVNHIIWVGFLSLLSQQTNSILVSAPAILLSLLYSGILWKIAFDPPSNSPSDAFFTFDGWSVLLQDHLVVIASFAHFCVMDLWLGKWTTQNFYQKIGRAVQQECRDRSRMPSSA